jgi:transposase
MAIAIKKSAHVSEQKRRDVLQRRLDWLAWRLSVDPERLVFIDETGATTNMACRSGRSPRGTRLLADIPHGHWKTTTLVAGLHLSGISGPMLLDGPMTAASLQAYIGQVLVPTLNPGDLVVMHKLHAHGRTGIRRTIENAGVTLAYLPPYSPDFNPIEQAFSILKACLRKAMARYVEDLLDYHYAGHRYHL